MADTCLKISKDAKFERDLLKTNKLIELLKNVSQLCGTISSLTSNLVTFNLVGFLILRRSSQQCQWKFANLFLSTMEGSIDVTSVTWVYEKQLCSMQ